MDDKLQAGDGEITLDDDQVEDENVQNQQTDEVGAELAPAPGDNQDKNEDGKTAQEKANKAINKQHAKFRDEERKRIAADKRIEELTDKLAASEAQTGEILIPPMPDAYDHEDGEYALLVKARDDAIAQKAVQDANIQVVTDQKTAKVETAKQDGVAEVNILVEKYDERSTQLGLSAAEMEKYGKTVMDYGISGEVAVFILQQEDGPLITKYLATNPLILDDLRNMSSIDAGLKISSDIRKAASKLKPQATNAPDPVEQLNGAGAGETGYPLTKGATFT